jgi:hypothetical protein
VDADRIVQKVSLELSRRIFSTNLIILNSQGIDVILGMRWMKLHRAVLDIGADWFIWTHLCMVRSSSTFL